MKHLILLLFLTPLFLQAKETEKRLPQIYRTSSEIDTKLSANNAVFTFQFEANGNLLEPALIQYSIDGKNGQQLSKKNSISIETAPGKHLFQFYYNENYLEVYSDSLEIKSQNRDTYTVNLIRAIQPMYNVSEKPVIYLYPPNDTDVTITMDIHGKNAFLYPTYIDSWQFTAHPNGDLSFGDKTYNYLFWEATTATIPSEKQLESGFFVKGSEAISFFEEKLTLAGLNSKEQADFITYWGPRLAKNELNFVHFEFNEECQKYADIDIAPKPDHLYRIYLTFGAVDRTFEVQEQEIQKIDRTGFLVLEWGGQEQSIQPTILLN